MSLREPKPGEKVKIRPDLPKEWFPPEFQDKHRNLTFEVKRYNSGAEKIYNLLYCWKCPIM